MNSEANSMKVHMLKPDTGIFSVQKRKKTQPLHFPMFFPQEKKNPTI